MKISLEADRAYYEKGIEELEKYLLARDLYWPSRAPTSDLTQLTPGGLLLVRARLGGWMAGGLENADFHLGQVRSAWASAWQEKVRHEVHSRGELWHQFLAEYSHDPRSGARLYATNVRQRAILAVLGETDDSMDGYLKSIFRPGRFVWDEHVQGGFSQTDFWFLYGNIDPKD